MKQKIWTLVLLWLIPLTTGEDVTVTCLFSRDCVLPCTSTYHHFIQWSKSGKAVHTFDSDEGRLENQDAAFEDRTSLFTDQISQGNVSLLIRGVRVEDEGIYTCYTSSGSEDLENIVWLNVKAPIHRVDIKLSNNEVTCHASDVYPEPIVSWYENYTLKPNFMNETQRDEQGLFSLKSNFNYSQNVETKTHRNRFIKLKTIVTCSISFEDESQNYTATLSQEMVDIYSGDDAKIRCPVSRGDAELITLRFGNSSTILESRQTNITVQWRGTDVHLGHDGNVTLHNLDMNNHTGNYACERSTARSRIIVHTTVHIIPDIHKSTIAESHSVAVAVMSVLSLLIYCLCSRNERKRRRGQISKEKKKIERELEPLSKESHSSDTYSSNGSVSGE